MHALGVVWMTSLLKLQRWKLGFALIMSIPTAFADLDERFSAKYL